MKNKNFFYLAQKINSVLSLLHDKTSHCCPPEVIPDGGFQETEMITLLYGLTVDTKNLHKVYFPVKFIYHLRGLSYT